MNFKWLRPKVTWVIFFLGESQQMEAWNKLSFSQDLGKKDLGTFFLTLNQESYPQKKDWSEAHEIV